MTRGSPGEQEAMYVPERATGGVIIDISNDSSDDESMDVVANTDTVVGVEDAAGEVSIASDVLMEDADKSLTFGFKPFPQHTGIPFLGKKFEAQREVCNPTTLIAQPAIPHSPVPLAAHFARLSVSCL